MRRPVTFGPGRRLLVHVGLPGIFRIRGLCCGNPSLMKLIKGQSSRVTRRPRPGRMHGQQAVAPAARSSTDSAGGRGRGGRSGLEQLDDDSLDIGAREAALQGVPLEDDVEENLRLFRLITGPSSDIAMRRMIGRGGPTLRGAHIQGIVDRVRTRSLPCRSYWGRGHAGRGPHALMWGASGATGHGGGRRG